jgi:prepilin-type N-terminal cleavage/methylation domain-containing protein
MDRERGFTLIEAAIVMAVMAALAVAAGAGFSAARRNAVVGSTAYDLALFLQGLKTKALAEQGDIVVVFVNPQGNVSDGCTVFAPEKCLRMYVLSRPNDAWTLGAFDLESPATNASVLEERPLPPGVALDLEAAIAAKTAPPPFAGVQHIDPAVRGSCESRLCVALRFGSNGETTPVYAGTATPTLHGVAFGLRSDLESSSATRRALLVSFPTGMVKSFIY